MNISDQDNASTDGYQETLAQHVTPDDQFIRKQSDRKLQMQPAAKQALDQLEPLLKDQQDFGWLDKIFPNLRAWHDKNDDLHTIEVAKAAIQDHIAHANKMLSKQHQADLLRARIEELEVSGHQMASEPHDFVYYRKRLAELQAELDKLEGEK